MKTLQNYIDGTWTDSQDPNRLTVINPSTEEPVAEFPQGAEADVDLAVISARTAQSAWRALTVEDRVARIIRWADRIEEHTDELAELECREMGKPVGIGRNFIAAGVEG